MIKDLEIIPAGDSAMFCRLSDIISTEISLKVVAFHELIKAKRILGILESVPSYSGLLIYFDPLILSHDDFDTTIRSLFKESVSSSLNKTQRHIKLPVCYASEFGPDLILVSERSKLSPEEVINTHCKPDYRVYMIGFTPGFPYMGGLDDRLETPRKEKPREKIRAGSVGIAGKQTGIYPIDSPGGWQIIGKTPLNLYNPESDPAFYFRAGDCVNFYNISLTEYFDLGEKVRNGTYLPEITIENERH